MTLDYVALAILIAVALILFYGVIVIHDIPYEIAKERRHPHQDAIHYAGWVSLFTLHALWPLLWIWATLWREDRGWDAPHCRRAAGAASASGNGGPAAGTGPARGGRSESEGGKIMETLMLLTYAALCIVVFKVFRIPLNKWTVPTAVLGGIALIGAVIFGMNYNFPYTDVGNQVFRTVPIVSQVRGRVQSVPVKPNQMLHKGDVLFTLDPTPFQAKVDDLQAQIKAASQDALSLNAALSQAQAELSRAVAQRDQSRRVCPLSGGPCPGRLLRSNG